MELVNLTGHPVVLIAESGDRIVVPATHPRAREARSEELRGSVQVGAARVPLFAVAALNDVSCLPAPRSGVWLVVSQLTALAAPTRTDLVYPHQVVRDDQGQPLYASGLAVPAR